MFSAFHLSEYQLTFITVNHLNGKLHDNELPVKKAAMSIEHVPMHDWSRDNGRPFFCRIKVGDAEGELSAVIVINWFTEWRDHGVN